MEYIELQKIIDKYSKMYFTSTETLKCVLEVLDTIDLKKIWRAMSSQHGKRSKSYPYCNKDNKLPPLSICKQYKNIHELLSRSIFCYMEKFVNKEGMTWVNACSREEWGKGYDKKGYPLQYSDLSGYMVIHNTSDNDRYYSCIRNCFNFIRQVIIK